MGNFENFFKSLEIMRFLADNYGCNQYIQKEKTPWKTRPDFLRIPNVNTTPTIRESRK